MSSSVHFKFKSQKEPSRVTFDGTGISVFELKREIININRLGDGTDFELSIYNEDTNEEYEDDTTIIPRSTSVIARRLPAARPGRGGAARYVSGKAPVNARNASRIEPSFSKVARGANGLSNNGIMELNEALSEEDRIKAVLNLESSQWSQQQQEMANATPVPFGRGRPKQNIPTGPERPLPPGYLCYRCREKGHWIHNCPTNNDPNFDGRVRVKRTTGIPRSQLKTVEKPELLNLDGSGGDAKVSGVMVNAEGDFVIAQPDKATWEIYSEKLKEISAAEKQAEASDTRELQSQGLECPIDKRMFVEPMKTPCCEKTYCNDCITNALIDSDFICPGCSTAGVLIDDLTVDDDVVAKLKSYETGKANARREKERKQEEEEDQEVESPSSEEKAKIDVECSPKRDASDLPTSNKKRPASAGNDEAGPGKLDAPSATKKAKPEEKQAAGESIKNELETTAGTHNKGDFPLDMTFNPNMSFGQFNPIGTQGVLPMSFPNHFMGMPGNPMMMQPNGFVNMNGGWNAMPGMDFNAMYGNGGFPNPMMQANMFPQMQNPQMNTNNMGPNQGNQFQQQLRLGPNIHNFSNQQRPNFNGQFAKEEENAYMRPPVNPHRHQARQKRIRPHDYREL